MNILVGLSGGVDSAVSAYILKQQGHNVIGAIMSIWDSSIPAPKNLSTNTCFGPEERDIESAQKIADFLEIPFYVINCKEEYKKAVLENFKNEYREGRTPNPCVWCNACIKFGVFPNLAKKNGILFEKFATGHYAKVKFNKILKLHQLCKAKDQDKDQTYFLYRLTQKTLSNIIFPLGRYLKTQVREIAKSAKLPVAQKPDSQDFYCGDYNDILNFAANPGDIIDKNGKVLGKHKGVWNYTIGKRKGLGLPGGSKEPLYVTAILAKQNIIAVGAKKDLYSSNLTLKKATWTSISKPKSSFKAQIKVRQQHKPAQALITPESKNLLKIKFSEPQMSITAGQSAVFYKDGIVLGGGIIE